MKAVSATGSTTMQGPPPPRGLTSGHSVHARKSTTCGAKGAVLAVMRSSSCWSSVRVCHQIHRSSPEAERVLCVECDMARGCPVQVTVR